VCGLKSEWPVMCGREDGAHNATEIGPLAGTVFDIEVVSHRG
jgi:hypothetical protein